jgi:hypothetical protein
MQLKRPPLLQLFIARESHTNQWYAALRKHRMFCEHEALRQLWDELSAVLERPDSELLGARQGRGAV